MLCNLFRNEKSNNHTFTEWQCWCKSNVLLLDIAAFQSGFSFFKQGVGQGSGEAFFIVSGSVIYFALHFVKIAIQ